MSCERIRKHLTSYLEGEVDGDLGSVIRGHLRGCDTCRGLAADEAALRDGLRAMPSLDPPSSMWAGIHARLAREEVADSKRPAWRRAMARWALTPMRFATGGFVMAAAVTLVWWKTRPADEPVQVVETPDRDDHRVHVQTPDAPPTAADDVTKDLAKDAERETSGWQKSAEQLLALAKDARERWSDDKKIVFDARVTKMRAAIAATPEGRQRQKAWRDLNRYLQGAVIRDVIASRDTALTGGAR